MKQYVDLCKDILENGVHFPNRTGVDTLAVFGRTMRFDLVNDSIPLLTTKKMFWKGIVHELIWMLSGDTNIRYLKQNKVKIWDNWIKKDTAEYNEQGELIAGDLPKIYQHQWRYWDDTRIIECSEINHYFSKDFTVIDETISGKVVVNRKIDQIKKIIDQLKNTPESRRIILSAWNVAEIEEMALPPCHLLCQFHAEPMSFEERAVQLFKTLSPEAVDYINRSQNNEEIEEMLTVNEIPKYKLSCLLLLRSNDVPLGNPYNIVQYSLLTKMIAQCVNMIPKELVYVGGNVHHYCNQLDGIKEQITREPFTQPKMTLNPNVKDIFSFTINDFTLSEYDNYHPTINFPIAT